jgi:hypothetical protein
MIWLIQMLRWTNVRAACLQQAFYLVEDAHEGKRFFVLSTVESA